MKIAYTYYWNQNPHALLYGFKTGDPLAVAYTGTVDTDRVPNYDSLLIDAVLDYLFDKFNADRPSDYRGPSMSVGSVITVEGLSYSVAFSGFIGFVDISQSEGVAA